MKLTIEEKAVIAHFLKEDPSWRGSIGAYWPFMFPPIASGIYGIINQDYIASSLGFSLFVCFAVWFFYHGGKAGEHLKSAIQKYENEISALGD